MIANGPNAETLLGWIRKYKFSRLNSMKIIAADLHENLSKITFVKHEIDKVLGQT